MAPVGSREPNYCWSCSLEVNQNVVNFYEKQRAREIRGKIIEEQHEALEKLNTGSKKIRVKGNEGKD